MSNPPTLSHQINSRLFATFLTAWLLLALFITLGLAAFYYTDRSYSRVLDQSIEIQSGARRLSAEFFAEVLNTRAYLISDDESAVTTRRLAHQEAQRHQEALAQQLAAYRRLEAPSFERLAALHVEYDAVAEQLIELHASGSSDEALELFDAQSDPLVQAAQEASRDLQREIQNGLVEASRENSRRTGLAILVVAALYLGTSTLAGVVLLLRVAPPLRTLDFFETALVNAGDTQVYQTIEGAPPAGGALPTEDEPGLLSANTRLLAAYNRLVRRMLDGNASLLKYISHLNHDVNSQLASILGYGYMIADPSLRPEDARLEEYGQVIVDQARSASWLVEDFVLAARIEAGHFAPVLLPLRLAPLLQTLTEEIAADCGRDVRLEGSPGTWVVLGDALSLEKALRKLLDNAILYSPPGSPVRLRVESGSGGQTGAQSRRRREVRLHVIDQGIGIAAEDLPRLFQPFSRIKNDATRGIPGNGLGLFIAQAIVRAHGGRITVSGAPGEGTAFTITLPLEE